jgi:arylsulfatase A-like enzyme
MLLPLIAPRPIPSLAFARCTIAATIMMLLGCHRLSAEEPRPPNVVIVLADDLGWADPGCYGSKFHRMPNVDRLAADGLRCTDAYALAPVCSPTRAALMTGKYPARLHLTDWLPGRGDRPDQKLLRPTIRQQLPLEETTLAKALKAAGYSTAHIGKWHLGGEGFDPQKQGFDLNIAGDETGTPLSYFAPFMRKVGTRERFMPGLEDAPRGEYLTDRLTAEAEKFIAKNAERPFFLYLAHYAPHIPMRAREELIKKYPQEMKPGQQSNAVYAAMLESLDQSVGRVVNKLEELKLGRQTIIIFASDNGGLATLEGPNTPPTINTPLREGKGWLYEGGIRVPLIVRWTGTIKAGTVSAVPVGLHDLFPTLVEACGGKAEAKVDGVSLLPLWKGGDAPRREALFWHYPHYSNQDSRPGASIRWGDHKLIEFYEDGRRELYDLKTDIGESRNLIEEKPELARKLADRLDAWRTEVDAQMMRPNPDFVPNPQMKDGTITLHARTAQVHGVQLRFEPLPHKYTLGYWTRGDDWVSWDFQVDKPGTFAVEIVQACGSGQGDSEVEFSVGEQTLKVVVEDTGDFRNFKARTIGTIQLDKVGRSTLTVKVKSKAKAAVMDLRQVVLKAKE